jgi:hypothetical protein
MDCHSNHPKQPSDCREWDTSIKSIPSIFASLSEPEEEDTSDALSFDEDDMYGSDSGKDIIVTLPDSEDPIHEDDVYNSNTGDDIPSTLPESEDAVQSFGEDDIDGSLYGSNIGSLKNPSDDVILTLLESADDVQAFLVAMVSCHGRVVLFSFLS